jgi:short-subunit dehydrogenase
MQSSPTPSTRSIVITGASSGIGASLARLAASGGWSVLLVARRAERLADVARTIGARAQTLVLDVTTPDAPRRITDGALRAFGRIDVVVNNAGHAIAGNLLEQDSPAIERQWQLHVAAPLRIARTALPHVREAHGGFVFVGSGLARVPSPRYGAYCAAKAAVRAVSIQLRRELRSQGVFVMYVDPGAVATEFAEASGMQRGTGWWIAQPDAVAARILRGIERRSARVNAQPWQTAATVIGEWLPGLTDAVVASFVAQPAPSTAAVVAEPRSAPEPIPSVAPSDAFAQAIEPVRRRMERVKLEEQFVRSLLVPDSTIELHDAAMRWAGMPNKNERAALHEVLDALAAAGFLESSGEERWLVRRAAT